MGAPTSLHESGSTRLVGRNDPLFTPGMEISMLRLLSIPGLALLGALTFFSAPGGQVAASECSSGTPHPCWENEACINIIFYKQCTTKYKYYSGGTGEI